MKLDLAGFEIRLRPIVASVFGLQEELMVVELMVDGGYAVCTAGRVLQCYMPGKYGLKCAFGVLHMVLQGAA